MGAVVERAPGLYRVLAEESLGAEAAAVFEALFRDLKVSPGDVLIDLRAVRFMGSTGVGLLVGLHRAAEAVGRRMILIAPSAFVRSLLSLSSLHQVLSIAESESEGMKLLAGRTAR